MRRAERAGEVERPAACPYPEVQKARQSETSDGCLAVAVDRAMEQAPVKKRIHIAGSQTPTEMRDARLPVTASHAVDP